MWFGQFLVAMALAFAVSHMVFAEPQAGEYGQPRILIPAPSDPRYTHLAWPKIVKTIDGTLVMAYVAGPKHGEGGCPAVSVSTDGGATFTTPQILANFDRTTACRHCGNVALGAAPDRSIILLAMAFAGDVRNTIYGWRSTDAGQSWTATDTAQIGHNQTGSVYGHVFPVWDRQVAVCGHYRKPRGHGIWIAYSSDCGESWGPPTTISEQQLAEPAFVFAEDRLIGLVRENAAHAYHLFVGFDQGKTWRQPQLVLQGDRTAIHPSPCIVADPCRPARLYALQSQRTRPGEVYLWAADADSLQWTRRGLVATFPGCQDYSYPWMTHLEGNEWFVVFYAGQMNGPNSIYGMRVVIDDEPMTVGSP